MEARARGAHDAASILRDVARRADEIVELIARRLFDQPELAPAMRNALVSLASSGARGACLFATLIHLAEAHGSHPLTSYILSRFIRSTVSEVTDRRVVARRLLERSEFRRLELLRPIEYLVYLIVKRVRDKGEIEQVQASQLFATIWSLVWGGDGGYWATRVSRAARLAAPLVLAAPLSRVYRIISRYSERELIVGEYVEEESSQGLVAVVEPFSLYTSPSVVRLGDGCILVFDGDSGVVFWRQVGVR